MGFTALPLIYHRNVKISELLIHLYTVLINRLYRSGGPQRLPKEMLTTLVTIRQHQMRRWNKTRVGYSRGLRLGELPPPHDF